MVHDEEINVRNLIIRGRVENVSNYEDFIFVLINGKVYPWPIENGHFRGLVQLSGRHNIIYFQYGQSVNTTITLHYIPQIDVPSLKIAVFYCKDSTLKLPFTDLIHPNDTRDLSEIKRDIQDKVSTGVQLIQSLIGEINYIQRESRQSFNLENSATMKHSADLVKIHFVPLDATIQELAEKCNNRASNSGSYSEFAPFIKALQSYGYPFDSNQLVLGFLLDPLTNSNSEQEVCEMNSILTTPHFKLGLYSCSTIFSWPSNIQIYEHLSKLSAAELAVEHNFDYKTYDLGELWDFSLSKLYHLMLSLLNLKSKSELEEGFNEEDLILKAFIQKPFDTNTKKLTPGAYLGSLVFEKYKSIEFAYHPVARAYEEYLNPDYHLTANPSIYLADNGIVIVSSTKLTAIRAIVGGHEYYLPCKHTPMQPLRISSRLWTTLKVKMPIDLYIHTISGSYTFIENVESLFTTLLVDFSNNIRYYRSPSPLVKESLEDVSHFDFKFYRMRADFVRITIFGNDQMITGIRFQSGNEISSFGNCNTQLNKGQSFHIQNPLVGLKLYQGTKGIVGISLLSNTKEDIVYGSKKGYLVYCNQPPNSLVAGVYGQYNSKGLLNLGIIHSAFSLKK